LIHEDPAASVALLPQKVKFTRKSITLETMNRMVEIQKQLHDLNKDMCELLLASDPILRQAEETNLIVLWVDCRSSKSSKKRHGWLK
jgi:hypothetical protein